MDFFVLRRQRLSLRDLYLPARESAYRFWGGYNPIAFAAVILGGLVYALLLNPVTYEPAGWFIYLTASAPAFIVAGAVHYLGTRVMTRSSDWGGYDSQSSEPRRRAAVDDDVR